MSDNEIPENVQKLENPLNETVFPEGPLKQIVVDFVGTKLQPENNQVNLEMIVNTFMEEFPEFVLALAEENFIRGYQQAMADIEAQAKDSIPDAEIIDLPPETP